jgi:hydroxymethylglutaryl-CoA lyase
MIKGPGVIRIYEVGLRDGLQIQKKILTTDEKLALVKSLIKAGCKDIQATSFVHPRLVPQLADAEELIQNTEKPESVRLWALVPNERGIERAAKCSNLFGVSIVLSASDSHNISNIRMKTSESLAKLPVLFAAARSAGLIVRVELATSFGCPFEGAVPIERIIDIARVVYDLKADHLALADTTGMADPMLVAQRVQAVHAAVPGLKLSGHFHNTRGAGMANTLAAWQAGVDIFDASFGGLGGCPFAPGATGNVATEDMVHMFHQMGVETHTDLNELIKTAQKAQAFFGFELPGQVMKAGPASKLHNLGYEGND